MNIVHPVFLLLLPAAPLLGAAWFWLHARAQRRLAAAIPGAVRETFFPRRRRFVFPAQLSLLTAGLMLLALAASRPQWGLRDEAVVTRGRNLLVAVDVSRSMLARDVHPDRLGRAKADLRDLVDGLRGDRAAILAFRRAAVLLCPLTTDTAFLFQTVENLSPERAPAGPTDLAAAIHAALDALDSAQDEHNAILLISDGEELTGDSLDAARRAGKRGIPIFTVGLGDPAGSPVPDGKGGFLQHGGKDVVSALDETALQAIAKASGGTYIPLATAGTAHATLGSIYANHLRALAAREQRETRENQIQERYNVFLIPAVILLLAALGLSRGRLAPARKNTRGVVNIAALLVFLFALFARPCLAATNTTGAAAAREAQTLFRKGQALEAAQLFERASRTTTPDRSPPFAFNAGIAFYEANETNDALRVLSTLADDSRFGPRANDLLAKITLDAPATNAALRLKALESSAGWLQRSLRAAPNDTREKNFARVAPLIARAREDARIEALLERHGQTPPQQLLEKLLADQRKILSAASGVFTNAPAERIAAAERLAKQQRENAGIWVPLKPALLQGLTNETERAELERLVEQTRETMDDAAARFDNLDPEAAASATLAETLPYRLWFISAEPPALIEENILLQTNALVSADAPLFPMRPDQPEAHRLTQR
ncbi:MAG: VWA domain-containing protein, partial [Kiritimatiellaeota bacterium]|nr:VWA domain-containing protein [Kiritimatiellota bacterium]